MLEPVSSVLKIECYDWRQNQRRNISAYRGFISVSAKFNHFKCFGAWINGGRDGLTRYILKVFASYFAVWRNKFPAFGFIHVQTLCENVILVGLGILLRDISILTVLRIAPGFSILAALRTIRRSLSFVGVVRRRHCTGLCKVVGPGMVRGPVADRVVFLFAFWGFRLFFRLLRNGTVAPFRIAIISFLRARFWGNSPPPFLPR